MPKRHKHLTCKICGTDLEVPLCCSKEMVASDGFFMCNLCGSKEDIPICCYKQMIVV